MADEQKKDGPGQPTACTLEVLEKSKAYLRIYNTGDDPEVVPTIEGLSLYVEVPRSTIRNWIAAPAQYPEFWKIYEKLMALQGKSLVSNGLGGKFNSPITKLLLTKHDYIEKTEVDNKITTTEPSAEEKAKLDAILNGTKKNEQQPEQPKPASPAQQGSTGDSNQGKSTGTEVPNK